MPIITQCPACERKLRVPDELLGKLVKCPGCGDAFTAADKAAALPPKPDSKSKPEPKPEPKSDLKPAASGMAALDNLDLQIDEPAPLPPPPRAAPPPPAPRKEDKPKERIVTPAPSREPVRAKPVSKAKPRPADDEEDEDDGKEPCPYCGERIKPSSIRCKYCGEELDDEEEEDEYEERPSRRGKKRSKRGIRRDALPHRGGTILTLGIISVVSLAMDVLLSCCCLPAGWVMNLVGLGTGIPAWIMGQRDLARMRTGEMDPSGKGSTQTGWICGMIGTILSVLFLAGGIIFMIIYGAAIMSGAFMNPGGGNPNQGNPFGPQPGPGRKFSVEPGERKLWHYLSSREMRILPPGWGS
jgi:predicted Zn finger-like uncharacterized protein